MKTTKSPNDPGKGKKQQVNCPECNSYDVTSGRKEIATLGIALIASAFWVALISAIILGPLAIFVFLIMMGLGILFVVGAFLSKFAQYLPKKYRSKLSKYSCNNCKYMWEVEIE